MKLINEDELNNNFNNEDCIKDDSVTIILNGRQSIIIQDKELPSIDCESPIKPPIRTNVHNELQDLQGGSNNVFNTIFT